MCCSYKNVSQQLKSHAPTTVVMLMEKVTNHAAIDKTAKCQMCIIPHQITQDLLSAEWHDTVSYARSLVNQSIDPAVWMFFTGMTTSINIAWRHKPISYKRGTSAWIIQGLLLTVPALFIDILAKVENLNK